MRRALLLTCLLLFPTLALADDDPCKHASPRELKLDLAGVKTVTFDIGHNELRLDARPGAAGAVNGRACASNAGDLDRLKLTQQKSGDELLVKAWRDGNGLGSFFGNHYAELRLTATIPDNLAVRLDVGSGDAWVTGVSSLKLDAGSGDVDVRRVRDDVVAKVGSGDLEFDDIGALDLLSVGSGDVGAANVRGSVKVGSIGSGDFALKRAGGDLEIGSIGSGDASVSGISGSVSVGSIGSGDLDVRDVGGNLTVRSKGSGDVDHSGVKGTVDIPRRR